MMEKHSRYVQIRFCCEASTYIVLFEGKSGSRGETRQGEGRHSFFRCIECLHRIWHLPYDIKLKLIHLFPH